MYSSDRMKTLISIYKDCDKNIVLRDCQMNFWIFFLEERRCFWFLPSFLLKFPPKNQPLLDYCWDISRYLERLQRTTTQLFMWEWYICTHTDTDCSYYIVCTVEMLNVTLCNESPRGTWMVSNQSPIPVEAMEPLRSPPPRSWPQQNNYPSLIQHQT